MRKGICTFGGTEKPHLMFKLGETNYHYCPKHDPHLFPTENK